MSSSSQPEDYSITLDNTSFDTITITGGAGNSYSYISGIDTISISPGTTTYNTGSTYSINTSGVSGLSTAQINTINTISSISISDLTFNAPIEFVDCMPDFSRIEKMCAEYPGLKIAFEKFKTTYYLVKDDYDTPKDKRVKP